MFARILAVALLVSLLSGCIFVGDGYGYRPAGPRGPYRYHGDASVPAHLA